MTCMRQEVLRTSDGCLTSWFKEGGKGQRARLENATKTATHHLKFEAKSVKGAYFSEMDHELFVWIQRNQASCQNFEHKTFSSLRIPGDWTSGGHPIKDMRQAFKWAKLA